MTSHCSCTFNCHSSNDPRVFTDSWAQQYTNFICLQWQFRRLNIQGFKSVLTQTLKTSWVVNESKSGSWRTQVLEYTMKSSLEVRQVRHIQQCFLSITFASNSHPLHLSAKFKSAQGIRPLSGHRVLQESTSHTNQKVFQRCRSRRCFLVAWGGCAC